MADNSNAAPGATQPDPFAVALAQNVPWRPCAFIVGKPSSGMSSLLDLIRDILQQEAAHG